MLEDDAGERARPVRDDERGRDDAPCTGYDRPPLLIDTGVR